MSNYPSQLDTDAELPLVSNNITEIGAEVINAIRSAIFALESTLGTEVQGSAQSLKDRLDAVLNPDGSFKAAALVAAGLIALPITNSMVGASAGIEESKLNLDYSTQALYTMISSNDIDIATLQAAINAILANFLTHTSGAGFKHDGYQILLDTDYPSSPPPDILPLSAVSIGEAVFQIKELLFNHIDGSVAGAHAASSISVDTSSLTNITATNLQSAIEQLEVIDETLFIDHRDDLHANGFSNFANTRDGYSTSRQLLPSTFGQFVPAFIASDRQTVQIDGYNLSSFGVSAGDVLRVIFADNTVSNYTIDAIGPRLAIGSLSALTASQLAVSENIDQDGYVTINISSPSSVSTFKGNMAPTIHQSDIRVDSIQVSRPNAARVLSLGINPRFINSTHTIGIEVGVGAGLSRSISIGNLHYDRYEVPVADVTLDTIVERINHVFQNRVDGYAFPAAAYRVGDELLISHNWVGSDDYYIKITSAGSTSTALYVLGFDDYGAAIVDVEIRPTHTAHFYVAGVKLTDVGQILNATANVMSQTFTFPGGENPLDLGVKPGHLLHLKNHANTNEIGTYFITGVNASSVVVHKNSGITTQSNVQIEIIHDAIPLDELQGYSNQAVIETYYTSRGTAGFRLRAENDLVTNVTDAIHIIDISDNYVSGSSMINVTNSGAGKGISFSNGVSKYIPYDFNGKLSLRSSDNSSSVTLDITSPVTGTGSITLTVHEHVLEEEVLELCSAWFDSSITIRNIVDKRLFGNTGLDELREDVVQAYSELPLKELRSDGVVTGFDIISSNYTDAESIAGLGSNIYGVLFRGGISYVDGVRSEVGTTPVFFPYKAANYLVYINSIGNIQYVEYGLSELDGYFSLSEILDGYAGRVAPLATVQHSGAGVTPITAQDLRFFINNIDEKIEFVLDATNKRIGTFASYEAAEAYINNMPHDSSAKLKLVSNNKSYNIATSTSSETFNLEVFGSFGTLTLNSSAVITAPGGSDRADAHIQSIQVNANATNTIISGVKIASGVSASAMSQDSKIVFNGAVFEGAVSIVSDGIVEFNDCVFEPSSSLQITAGKIVINSGEIFSSLVEIISDNTISNNSFSDISDSLFRTSASTIHLEATDGSSIAVRGCQFEGSASALTVEAEGIVRFSECTFADIVAGSGAIIYAGSVSGPDTYVMIEGSTFDAISLSGTAKYTDCATVDKKIAIQNCIFDNSTISNNTAVNAILTKFVGNFIVSSGLNIAINGAGGEVVSNTGLASAQYSSTSTSNEIRIITGNKFASSAPIGYNLLLNNSSNVVHALSIRDNYFTSKLTLGDQSARIIIDSNIFTGSNPNCGIDFGTHTVAAASEPVSIYGNVFSCETAFTFSEEKFPLHINNNIFQSTLTSNTTVRISNDSSFSQNIYLDTTDVVILTSTASRIKVCGNTLAGGLRLQGGFSDSVVSENVISGTMHLETSASLSNSIIDRNSIYHIQFNTGNTFDYIRFCNNIVESISDSDLAVWQQSIISGNDLSAAVGGSGVITFYSGVNGQNCISNNSFKSMVGLQASTTVLSCTVDGNIFDNKALVAYSIIEDTSILNNINCAITMSEGMDASQIYSNNLGANSIIVSGEISNSLINNNQAYNIEVACTPGSYKATINGNALSGSIVIFDSADIACEMSNISIVGNNIGADLIFQSHGGASATRSLSEAMISDNLIQSLDIFTTAAAASVTLEKVSIVSNRISQYFSIFAYTGVFNSISDIDISGNRVQLAFSFRRGDSSTKNLQDITINNNYFNGVCNVGDDGAFGTPAGFAITDMVISGNTFNATPRFQGVSINNCIISNNNSGSEFQIFGQIENFVATDNNADIDIRILTSGENINISGNIGTNLLLAAASGTPSISDIIISNNDMSDLTISSTIPLSNIRMSDNKFATVAFPAAITNGHISGNRISSLLDLSAASAADSVKRLFLFGNNVVSTAGTSGEIRLPALTCFASGADQSKFFSNYSYQWTASASFSAPASTRLHCLSNTSGTNSTNVELGANYNNVSTGSSGAIPNPS